MKRSRDMIRDIDYLAALTKQDKAWLQKAVSGIANANRKFLQDSNPGVSDEVYRECSSGADAARRDLMNVLTRVDSSAYQTDEEPCGLSHLMNTEGHSMSSFEDAMIEKIDSERLSGKPYTMGSYGENTDVPIGSDVVICIEGHALQSKIGTVTAKRKGQYLVNVQTVKGDISLFVSAHEIARTNYVQAVG